MADFYLGSTALNQTWLGNTQLNEGIASNIPSLYSVFPLSSVSNYWNCLSTASFEVQGCAFGATFVTRWYDDITGTWITASNNYGIPDASGLFTAVYDCTTPPPVYVGDGVGGANSYVELLYTTNDSFVAETSGSQFNFTSSFSWFFTTDLNNQFVSNGYNLTPFRFGNGITFNVSRSALDEFRAYYGLDGTTGSIQLYDSFIGTNASLQGWYGLTFDYPTKELKLYHNSATPTLVTSSATWDFEQLNLILTQEDSAGGWGMTFRLYDFILLNKVPTQTEIENYDAWSRTTYATLY
jgi:hypothetical protein